MPSSLPAAVARWGAMLLAAGLLAAGSAPPRPLRLAVQSASVAAALAAPVLGSIYRTSRLLPLLWFLLALWPLAGEPRRPARSPGQRWPAWLLVLVGGMQAAHPGSTPIRWTGWLAVGLVALWSSWPRAAQRGRGVPRPASGEALAVLMSGALSLWFLSSIRYWHGGWQVGPRYLASFLPLLAAAAAFAIEHWRSRWLHSLVGGAVAASAAVYVSAAAVFPHFPKSFRNPVHDLVGYLLGRGIVAPNIGTKLLGLAGLTSLLPAALIALVLLSWALAGPRPGAPGTGGLASWPGRQALAGGYARYVRLALAFCLATFYLATTAHLPSTDFERCCHWIEAHWPGKNQGAKR